MSMIIFLSIKKNNYTEIFFSECGADCELSYSELSCDLSPYVWFVLRIQAIIELLLELKIELNINEIKLWEDLQQKKLILKHKNLRKFWAYKFEKIVNIKIWTYKFEKILNSEYIPLLVKPSININLKKIIKLNHAYSEKK